MPEETVKDTVDATAETQGTPSEGAPSDLVDVGDFSNVPREALPWIQKARAQEKQKLYKEQKALKQQVQDLTTKLKEVETAARTSSTDDPDIPANVATRKRRDEEIAELRDMITGLTRELRDRDDRAQQSARQAAVQAYRRDQIAAVRAAGGNLIDALVSGNNEEEIDATLEVAKAEYALVQADIEKRLKVQAAPPPKVVVQQSTSRPTGVTPTVSASQAADRSSALSVEDLKELTSIEAIRDGRYAKHRVEILAAVRAGRITSTTGM